MLIAKPVLVTAPATEVVSLQSLKEYLKIDTTDDDAMLLVSLKAATKRLEQYSNQKFVTQTWDVFFDCFPYNGKNTPWWDGVREVAISDVYRSSNGGILEIPFGPLQSVTSFKTFNDDNTEFTFDSSNYYVDTAGKYGAIGLKTGAVWPSTVLRPLSGIAVRCVFGFGAGYITSPVTASTIPDQIQEAVKAFASVLFEHRGDEMPKIPATVGMLLEPYMRYKL